MGNLLRGTKFYGCGNLQNSSWKEVIAWRDYLKVELGKIGAISLSPLDKVFKNFEKEDLSLHDKLFECLKNGDLKTVHDRMKSIRRRDLALIDRSDFIVCVLDVGRPTYGTIEELVLSEKQNKPTFIVIQNGLPPLWLVGMFKPECFFTSLDDVISYIKKIDSGEIPITEEHWRIFENSYL